MWNFPSSGAPLRLYYSLRHLLSGKLKCWPRSGSGAEPNGEVKGCRDGTISKTFLWGWYRLWFPFGVCKIAPARTANREGPSAEETASAAPSHRQARLPAVQGPWRGRWRPCGPSSWRLPRVSPLSDLTGIRTNS